MKELIFEYKFIYYSWEGKYHMTDNTYPINQNFCLVSNIEESHLIREVKFPVLETRTFNLIRCIKRIIYKYLTN